MSIKFEGEPPFYLGVAETAAAQVLDTNVIIRTPILIELPWDDHLETLAA